MEGFMLRCRAFFVQSISAFVGVALTVIPKIYREERMNSLSMTITKRPWDLNCLSTQKMKKERLIIRWRILRHNKIFNFNWRWMLCVISSIIRARTQCVFWVSWEHWEEMWNIFQSIINTLRTRLWVLWSWKRRTDLTYKIMDRVS